MLSFMLPVADNPQVLHKKDGLNLGLVQSPPSPERRAVNYPTCTVSKDSSLSSFASSDNTVSSMTHSAVTDKHKQKLLGNGHKLISLKRVSFGSSKGSMVETLIYESPVREDSETTSPDISKPKEITSPTTNAQHAFERSKVRVSFYQGAKAQCVSPPPEETSLLNFYVMGTDMQQTHFDRQLSTESGWDNPFRPDGDLSKEADEIVSLIKGGKPITPTPDFGHDDTDKPYQGNKLALVPESPVSKKDGSVVQSGAKLTNGTKNGSAAVERTVGQVEVQRSAPDGPQQAEHVMIKKKSKCKCCVIQ